MESYYNKIREQDNWGLEKQRKFGKNHQLNPSAATIGAVGTNIRLYGHTKKATTPSSGTKRILDDRHQYTKDKDGEVSLPPLPLEI